MRNMEEMATLEMLHNACKVRKSAKEYVMPFLEDVRDILNALIAPKRRHNVISDTPIEVLYAQLKEFRVKQMIDPEIMTRQEYLMHKAKNEGLTIEEKMEFRFLIGFKPKRRKVAKWNREYYEQE